MADVYLRTNLIYPPEDVVLGTSSPDRAGSDRGGIATFKAHSLPQRAALTGRGHLHLTFTLEGTPGPIPVLTGEGTPISGGVLQVALKPSRSITRTYTPLIQTSGTARTSARLVPLLRADLTRIIDPDEWLLLDLPELA